MQSVVTAKEMRWCDERAIKGYGIPGHVLMENAGRGVVDVLSARFEPLPSKRALIFCGKGNNGGDGFVIARHLLNQGASVDVLLMASPEQYSGDARTNLRILQTIRRSKSLPLSIGRYSPTTVKKIPAPDFIVDAIFGTGFSGNIPAAIRSAMGWMMEQRAPTVSVDVPSGVDGSTGKAAAGAVRASVTVTMGLPKIGHYCNQGRELRGDLEVVDIGIPRSVYSEKRFKTWLVEEADLRAWLPARPHQAHKYSVGKVFMLAGAKGFAGAAALAAMGALRAGAGAVQLGVPEAIYHTMAKKVTEPVIVPLPATESGSVSIAAKGRVLDRIKWADAVVIGPGLSREQEVQDLLAAIINEAQADILLDADALFLLSKIGLKSLKRSKSRYILTPHTGEFSFLTTIPSADAEVRRIETARNAAAESKCVWVLKGSPTVTAAPDGTVYLNPTGNPGMATVGSGDVLSGVIAGLWAQGLDMARAAAAGVYLHGLAGDLAARKFGQRSIVAHDLLDSLPFTFRRLEG